MILIDDRIRNELSPFKDPFSKECVESVLISCRRDLFHHDIVKYMAIVEFKNGDTKGEQQLKAESLASLLDKVKTFLDSFDK